jgi:hypothetical protein
MSALHAPPPPASGTLLPLNLVYTTMCAGCSRQWARPVRDQNSQPRLPRLIAPASIEPRRRLHQMLTARTPLGAVGKMTAQSPGRVCRECRLGRTPWHTKNICIRLSSALYNHARTRTRTVRTLRWWVGAADDDGTASFRVVCRPHSAPTPSLPLSEDSTDGASSRFCDVVTYVRELE